jgi:hypothetical protein
MRVAIYYLPEADDPLWAAGCRWLGWDSERRQPCQRPRVPGLADATRRASRYGFHATIKAPMPLQGPLDDFVDAVRRRLSTVASFVLPPLILTQDEGFVALHLGHASSELAALANICVRDFDAFRRPYTATEMACREQKLANPRQQAYLEQWGYPYVFEEYVFHMTLTDQQSDTRLLREAETYLDGIQEQPRSVRSLALLLEKDAAAPFELWCRIPLAPSNWK